MLAVTHRFRYSNMYESFYGLNEKPFQLPPDARYFYCSESHHVALSALESAIDSQSGFAVVTGDTGAGKTLLIRKWLQKCDSALSIGLLSNTRLESTQSLLQWILLAFKLTPYDGESSARLYEVFTDYLAEQYAQGRRVVLIIDEAQHLSKALLEQLRLLSNINADDKNLLQLVLLGQPGLRATLMDVSMYSFVQRILVDSHIEQLDEVQTGEYINHRLSVAGAQREIFTASAVAGVWEKTGGVPRSINLLCDNALMFGFSEYLPLVGKDLIKDVVDEKREGLSALSATVASERKALPLQTVG